MKQQLSLELLVYLALAGIGILFAVAAISRYKTAYGDSASMYQYSGFLYGLAQAMYTNTGAFTAYVPQQLCAAGSQNVIRPADSGYYLPATVVLNKRLLCPAGTRHASLSQSSNGTWVLG